MGGEGDPQSSKRFLALRLNDEKGEDTLDALTGLEDIREDVLKMVGVQLQKSVKIK